MAQANKSSFLLLTTIFIILLAGGTYSGWSSFEKSKTAIRAEIKTINAKIAENDRWMNQADQWKQRGAWITTNQPVTSGPDDASLALIEGIQKSAAQENIQIADQKILPTKTTSNYFETSVTVKLHTDMKSLIEWLYLLQTPASFTVVESFSLKTDAQTPNLNCEFTLGRWYSPEFKKP